MAERTENQAHLADSSDSRSGLDLVAEWLHLSSPPAVEKGPARPLYGKDGAAGINPSAVIQGDVNDCFLMAPMAALAQNNKHFISDAINQNKDGSFTVTFPGAPDKPQKVAAPTAEELVKYARVSASGVWPAVMEKAFGQYLESNPEQRQELLGHSAGWFLHDPQEYADSGRAGAVFKLLTGYQPGGMDLVASHSAAGAASFLGSSFSGDKPESVVAGISKDNKAAEAMGLHPEHFYTVLGYANGLVTLRDPRGKTEDNESGRHVPSKDGVFTMKVEDFARSFDELLAARTKPLFSAGAIMIGRMPH